MRVNSLTVTQRIALLGGASALHLVDVEFVSDVVTESLRQHNHVQDPKLQLKLAKALPEVVKDSKAKNTRV